LKPNASGKKTGQKGLTAENETVQIRQNFAGKSSHPAFSRRGTPRAPKKRSLHIPYKIKGGERGGKKKLLYRNFFWGTTRTTASSRGGNKRKERGKRTG